MERIKVEGRGSGEDLAAMVRTYIQRQVNPMRAGCPSLQSIEAFAQGDLHGEVLDSFSAHLACCRECLMELKTFRDLLQY